MGEIVSVTQAVWCAHTGDGSMLRAHPHAGVPRFVQFLLRMPIFGEDKAELIEAFFPENTGVR